MTTGSVSARRADTRRNHERILAVAAESLSRSAELSFNAIAKQAEVGVGTVYRHFPTPEALILAVYQREVRHLVDVVPRPLAAHPPEVAFRVWITDHDNLISALHKSMRGSGPDAALYWLARMLDGGEDPLYIARRLVRFAGEDIGMADPHAVQQTLAAWDVYERLGSPEGELAIAQAVVYLATAPKSIAVYRGLTPPIAPPEAPAHSCHPPTSSTPRPG